MVLLKLLIFATVIHLSKQEDMGMYQQNLIYGRDGQLDLAHKH